MADHTGNADERPEPPAQAGEAETVLGFLDFLRATIAWKCAGLNDAQLNRRLAPSTMTLGGLLNHLSYVEQFWFGEVLSGDSPQPPWSEVDWKGHPDWDWEAAAAETGTLLRHRWEASVASARGHWARFLRAGGTLTGTRPLPGGEAVSVRWILIHMVEEYARHCGHADLLAEAADGRTGE